MSLSVLLDRVTASPKDNSEIISSTIFKRLGLHLNYWLRDVVGKRDKVR